MNERLNRRTALLAIGGATAVAAVPVAALASGSSVDRSAWDRAFAKMEKAKAVYAREDARHEPIWQAYHAATEAVPHATLKPDPYAGRLEPFTTEDSQYVRCAQRLVHDVAAGKSRLETDRYPSLAEHFERCKEAVEAVNSRAAEVARIDEQLGYTRSSDRQEKACNALVDAEGELHQIPSPDGQALLWKMENLWLDDEESSWSAPMVSSVLADARRLLSNGRA